MRIDRSSDYAHQNDISVTAEGLTFSRFIHNIIFRKSGSVLICVRNLQLVLVRLSDLNIRSTCFSIGLIEFVGSHSRR